MAQGPRTALQVTPQLLTPSQLMGAESPQEGWAPRLLLFGRSPRLTSGRLLGHPVTLARSQGPRPGHAHTSYPGRRLRFRAGHRPRVREVRHCLRMSAGALVTQRACSLRGWKLPGRLPALSGRTRSGPETACEQRKGRPQAAVRARSPRGRSAWDLVSYRRQRSLSELS